MTRYYYKDPIQALWMMKEFAVKFDNADEKSLLKTLWIVLVSNQVSLKEVPEINLYVAKESEHIFEPKDMDVGIVERGVGNSFYEYSTVRGYQGWNPINSGKVNDEIKIIMRDNKNFFNALIENND